MALTLFPFFSGRYIAYLLLYMLLLSGSIGPTFAQQNQRQRGTGTIRGSVTLSTDDEFTEEMIRGRELLRYQTHGAHSEEPIRPYRISEEIVVYVESAGGDTTYPIPEIHPRLNQHQMTFRPLVLPVLIGTTVDFPNLDNLYHNVFSYSQAKEFDLGRYPKGQSRSVTFEKQGVVKVYCDIHTYMFATILVLQNPYFTVPDDAGAYEISGVPPGTYRLSCWYGRKKVATQPVTVRAEQASIINFQF